MIAASSNLRCRISPAAPRSVATRARHGVWAHPRCAALAAATARSTCSTPALAKRPRTISLSMGEVSTIGAADEVIGSPPM